MKIFISRYRSQFFDLKNRKKNEKTNVDGICFFFEIIK